MLRGTHRASRYLRSWTTGWAPVEEHEIELLGEDGHFPGSLFLPTGPRSGIPGWVVLHGITRTGRAHPNLLRFARAAASTGAAVLIPDIPEWQDLVLATDRALPAILAAILALDERPETAPGRIGLVGFSFGAGQALIASADPSVRGHLAGVVGFGGHHRFDETMRFQFTGTHELDGVEHRLEPDAYGRWVVGANFITEIPGFEDAGDVARGLHALASWAGERRIPGSSADMDPLKVRIREGLLPAHREVFDLFAPPAGRMPDAGAGLEMAQALSDAMMRVAPRIDAVSFLEGVRVPVRLVHGREDQLIPFTQTLRLARAFRSDADVTASITGLFSHSQGSRRASPGHLAVEGVRLLRALSGIFAMV